MRSAVLAVTILAACGSSSATQGEPFPDGGTPDIDGAVAPCTTTVSYGSAWIHPSNHPESFDTIDGDITWDGTCTDNAPNSFAVLSNGFTPYFTGRQHCEMALDPTASCASATACTTRITYAPSWLPPANHPAQYDDVAGRVFTDGACTNTGAQSYANLSNGWQPHFNANDACGLSIRWTGCGGLYTNPVVPTNCPDPGVTFDGTQYVMSCTSGNAANGFPIYTSTDLVTWKPHGHILPSGSKPAWAKSDFWAPEIHKIGSTWVAYYSARGSDGKLALGTATATDILGPYTAQATPIVHSNTVGLIDVTVIADGATNYLVWKEDGNAISQPTPIRGGELSSDGLTMTRATPPQLITNDQTWEGNLVEGPFVVKHDGSYYLFYSGNAYYDGRYAVGVARATSPLGPYTKNPGNPILKTGGAWVGPGHCSVVDGPHGETYMVYHAWEQGHVNGAGDKREVLVDEVQWRSDGWPDVFGAPSAQQRPRP